MNETQPWIKAPRDLRWQNSGKEGSVISLCADKLIICDAEFFEQEKTQTLKLNWRNSSYDFQVKLLQTDDLNQRHLAIDFSAASANLWSDFLNVLRKNQHIDICQKEDVEASDRFTGFSELSFLPEALPKFRKEDLNSSRQFLNETFQAPILITGMTGGVHEGQSINRRLARLAQKYKIPMGVGSQRMALEKAEYRKIFTVKDQSPDIFLLANLGGAQLGSSDAISLCQQAVEMIQADALAIHLNVLQECVQVEGHASFSGLESNIAKICEVLKVPVIVKEVGSGISPQTAQRLCKLGVAAIDVGGKGGTSWGHIEGLRSQSKSTQALAKTFRDWGIPTAYSLAACRAQLSNFPLIATGGIRDGLNVAKAVALGADMVGVGLPFFRAALESFDKLEHCYLNFLDGLHTTMLLTDSQDLESLKDRLCVGLPCKQNFQQLVSRRQQHAN